jgi:hypothetical protein
MTKPDKMTVGKPTRPKLSLDGRTMTVSIPIALRHQGGRKRVVTPADARPWSPPPTNIDDTIIKALVRAHRWRSLLEQKIFKSVRDLAKAEKINESYLCRVLRLTLLSPAITEGILSGHQPLELELSDLLRPFPAEWGEQEAFLRAMLKTD